MANFFGRKKLKLKLKNKNRFKISKLPIAFCIIGRTLSLASKPSTAKNQAPPPKKKELPQLEIRQVRRK
jgi:hypothetical protein